MDQQVLKLIHSKKSKLCNKVLNLYLKSIKAVNNFERPKEVNSKFYL